jgi:fatty-acid desaturase
MKNLFYPREWFFITMQVIALFFTVYAVIYSNEMSLWMLSIFGYFLITCLGITITFHRLLAHRSYRLNKSLEYLFSFFGNLGCTGSSIGWVFVHRTHHAHTDKPGDPHSPVISGPLGAIIGDYSQKFNKWTVKDIIKDPVHRFMHEYYMLIVFAVCFIFTLIDFQIAMHLVWIPIFLNTAASRLSNWIDHTSLFGKRDYKIKDQSHNVWWWAWLTFGEGWHNNHHRYPGDFRIGRKWYQFDPGKYIIQFFILINLAENKNVQPITQSTS